MPRIEVKVRHFPDRSTLQLQWADPVTGKRKTKSSGTGDPDEAELRRADLEYELNHGLFTEPSKVTWEAFREMFEREYLPARRENTQRNYRRTLDLFEEHCRPANLSGITTRTCSQFVASLRMLPEPGRAGIVGFKPNTIAIHVELLCATFAWATEQGFLEKAPAFPPVPIPKKRPAPVPPELFERLMARLQCPQLRAFVLCGWLAGMRRNEAYSLSWEPSDAAPWLDLTRRRIIFPAEFVKGAEDQWVPLDPDLSSALQSLPRQNASVFNFGVCAQSVVRRIVIAARKAGVRLDYRSLRRGFGCRYAASVSAHVLQRLMRHSSITVTMSYYANIDSAVEEAILGHKNNGSGNTSAETSSIPGEK